MARITTGESSHSGREPQPSHVIQVRKSHVSSIIIMAAAFVLGVFVGPPLVALELQQWLPATTTTTTTTKTMEANNNNNNHLRSVESGSQANEAQTLVSSSSSSFPVPTTTRQPYKSSIIEQYFLDHGKEMGFDIQRVPKEIAPKGCTEWNETSSPIATEMATFRKELQEYKQRMTTFPGSSVKDLRTQIEIDGDYRICDTLEIHPDGLKGIFPSHSLSQSTLNGGLLEPIAPPMRHPEFCWTPLRRLFDLDYLVHDFATYCRSLTPSSRIILVDMGASLDFHGKHAPAIYLTHTYEKFGFHFDHVYAFEIDPKNTTELFENIPDDLFHAYHWINQGVDPTVGGKMNPWTMLLNEYNENDFIVVKLDIDTPAVENTLAQQLLDTPELTNLVDVFYFEHHVTFAEMMRFWGKTVDGSLLGSLELFVKLRERGVDSHSWV